MPPTGRHVRTLHQARAALAAIAALAFAGCADKRSKYPTAESPLELDRVVLYRNGVGYFERTGKLTGDLLTLKVRKDQIDDLLKSLTIVERKTGRAVSVSMPLDPTTWANAALSALRPGQGSLAQVLDTLRGTVVTIETKSGTTQGRIAMVEQVTLPSDDDDDDGAPRIDHRVSLLDGDRLFVVLLSDVRSVRLDDGDLAMQFNRSLDASAGEGMFQQVEVSIRLAGAKSYDLLVSYVVAAPMWKPTYRVVLPKDGKGKALLQAWAVVDNTSGEEWNDVTLALTSGTPIAFRYDLHTPREVSRPDLTERGVHRQATAMVGETTYDPTLPPPPPPRAPRSEAVSKQKSGRGSVAMPKAAAPLGGAASDAESGYDGRDYDDELDSKLEEIAAERSVDYDQLRRTTLAQTKAQTVAGQTRFELGERVTVPAGTSTMVAIVNADVEGEETFLFRPGGAGMGYEVNPYRVVRFKNSTPFVLEPGPIGIYAGGSFVGEGISETVGADTSATIPFAVETGIMVTSQSTADSDDMRLVKMSRGVLEVEQFARRTTTYTAKAQTLATGFTLLVRHPKAGWNFALADRPVGTEDVADGYLTRLVVAPNAKEGSLTLVEQTPSRTSISIWSAPAIGILEKLLLAGDLDADARKKLKPIVDRRREVARIDEQITGLTERRNKLDQRANELRENIRAIQRNPQAGPQRAKWTKQLDEFTSEGNKLGAQLADLEAKRLDQRVELEDALQELEITPPAQPAKRPTAKP